MPKPEESVQEDTAEETEEVAEDVVEGEETEVDETEEAQDQEQGAEDTQEKPAGAGEEAQKERDIELENARLQAKLEVLEKERDRSDSGKNFDPFELPEAEWDKLAENLETSKAQLKWTRDLVRAAVGMLDARMEHRYGGKIAENALSSALGELASDPKFKDAPGMVKDVREFFKDMGIPQSKWNDPKMLQKAVIYARGNKGGASRKSMKAGADLSRKVVTSTQSPADSGGKVRGKGKGATPTATEREAFSKIGYRYYKDIGAYVAAIRGKAK